ncbi:MAG: hypothetical protein ISR90_00710 [Candidatus Marinimicrobia bacterium]|nr:hypothetical protein [Candidatus Neomarinimicrobiota bacterium]MBL7022564.1 hypothetical protein [Candidatus Neomarinimicrobiota bacterium]MBL7108920.1 hypothetical protein [Candidatus Neomarinimicrobiota bacterium]
MKNNKVFVIPAIILFIVLVVIAFKDELIGKSPTHQMLPQEAVPHQHAEQPQMEIIQENVEISFGEKYQIDDEWGVEIIQFEPHCMLVEPIGNGKINSQSDAEMNPAIKVHFEKNGEFKHYQICYSQMPGMHTVKPEQKYFVEFLGYQGYKKTTDGKYIIEMATIQIGKVQ